MSDELPEGWALAKLGEITGPSAEKVDPSAAPNALYLSLEHIEPETGRILDHGKSSDASSTKSVFRAGDVLYGKLRPYLNKVCIPDFDGVCSTDILVFGPRAWVDNRFLRLFLSQRRVVDYATHNSAGIQLPRISFEKLSELDFPLPPLAEQKRIATRVEELLAQVNAARERLARVSAILKRFRQSVLAAACSGRLTTDWREQHLEQELGSQVLARIREDRAKRAARTKAPIAQADLQEQPHDIPATWAWATLDQIRQEGRPIIYGIIKPGPDDPEGVPYVRVMEMKDGRIDVAALRRASKARAAKFARATLAAGDVLISKDGTIGRVAVVPPELEGGNITQHLVRASIHPILVREYVVFAIRAPEMQRWLTGERKGVALQGVNVEDFRRLPIPIPPLPEQREIVRRIEALFALADAIEKRVAAAMVRVEKLTQAILAKAFRGKLVPTEAELARREGRDYEPASVLLARVRSERARSTPATGRHRSRQQP
jgi:type I restriction enzyme S subunit